MKIESLYLKFKESSSVSTDTRNLPKDCMYFALKGDNFDGNKFLPQAFVGGAKYCVTDDKNAVINKNCILVDNVLTTLQELASLHRTRIGIPIIALTGSNGKTTTKELINSVLSSQFSVKATIGNLNNHIGVPLTLLRFTQELDFGIVEMGANHQKEIAFLSQIAKPDYGLITNFGKAHLEGFGSVEGVIKGKSELYDYLKEHNQTLLINSDDATQVKQMDGYSKTITFGKDTKNDCVIEFISANPFVSVLFDGTHLNSQLIGDYNYQNIAVAIALGKHFKVSTENIKKAIEDYQPTNNRSQIIQKGSTKIILDAYNANPTSMLAALKNLNQLDEGTNKYLFLGDMLELGTHAEQEHQAIVKYVETNFKHHIYLIGQNFYNTKTLETTHKFSSFENLKPKLESLHLNDATILIKGSRGMALERILNYINLTP
ncbi:MAG: UDP-N-acetylmuramoyl-tripeptide--D-alanyl-D-alanine ligase [Winogradskyella sp.]|nr:UDP-N-acetylmuramoyl-tripeptide--D-alanyl-D-alanine ligase [Winogradskyella sp.]